MKALILNDAIIAVSEVPFDVHPSMMWITVPDECTSAWTYTDGTVSAYVEPEDTRTYKELRQKAYPPITDQLDQIYHEGVDAWKATILAVKEEFPK